MSTLFYLLAGGSWQYLACDKLYCLYFLLTHTMKSQNWKGLPKFPKWSLNEAEHPSWSLRMFPVWTAYLSIFHICFFSTFHRVLMSQLFFLVTKLGTLHTECSYKHLRCSNNYTSLYILTLDNFASPTVSALAWDLIMGPFIGTGNC